MHQGFGNPRGPCNRLDTSALESAPSKLFQRCRPDGQSAVFSIQLWTTGLALYSDRFAHDAA